MPTSVFIGADGVVRAVNPGPITVLWEQWKQFGPVRIAQQHLIPKTHRVLRLERIRVNEPVKIEPPR